MKSKYQHLKLKVLDGSFDYMLLDNSEPIAQQLQELQSEDPMALFWTKSEVSMVVRHGTKIASQKIEPDWNCIKIVGEMPFGTVQGLIATISSRLNAGQIGICVVSTFLTDWFFVKTKNLEAAKKLLTEDGWEFVS